MSDAEQIEKIRKEVEALSDVNKDIKYWDYTDVLEVHEALQKANESINKLGLVPASINKYGRYSPKRNGQGKEGEN